MGSNVAELSWVRRHAVNAASPPTYHATPSPRRKRSHSQSASRYHRPGRRSVIAAIQATAS
jgi:hypothetical protein